jgi:hypothetical protein
MLPDNTGGGERFHGVFAAFFKPASPNPFHPETNLKNPPVKRALK